MRSLVQINHLSENKLIGLEPTHQQLNSQCYLTPMQTPPQLSGLAVLGKVYSRQMAGVTQNFSLTTTQLTCGRETWAIAIYILHNFLSLTMAVHSPTSFLTVQYIVSRIVLVLTLVQCYPCVTPGHECRYSVPSGQGLNIPIFDFAALFPFLPGVNRLICDPGTLSRKLARENILIKH